MHNLGTVFKFEIIRTLKKRSFWLASLLFPIAVAAVAGIIFFSNKATQEASNSTENQQYSFAIKDDSGLINQQMVAAMKAEEVDSKEAGVSAVKSGELDAFFYYPANVTTEKVEIYGEDVGLFDNGRYEAVARELLTQSVASEVTETTATVLRGSVQTSATTYRDGEEYNGFMEMIAPGIFLILFYLMIATFGNQMLNATIEEKENRVIEMILTTINARALIVGKIFSLIVLGFLQMIIVLVPLVLAYLLFHDSFNLPNLNLSELPLDWQRIGVGFAIFAVSFVLFTGLLVAIGAAAPTAKEAGNFFGIVMIAIFGPLYAVTLFVSSPDMPIVQFLSYFPLTAPIPLLLRNAVGNLELWQAAISILILATTAVIVMWIAIRTFRYGALEYNRRLSLKEIFVRKA